MTVIVKLKIARESFCQTEVVALAVDVQDRRYIASRNGTVSVWLRRSCPITPKLEFPGRTR